MTINNGEHIVGITVHCYSKLSLPIKISITVFAKVHTKPQMYFLQFFFFFFLNTKLSNEKNLERQKFFGCTINKNRVFLGPLITFLIHLVKM